MPVSNAQIAEIFNNVADILDMEGENTFRITGVPDGGNVGGKFFAESCGYCYKR